MHHPAQLPIPQVAEAPAPHGLADDAGGEDGAQANPGQRLRKGVVVAECGRHDGDTVDTPKIPAIEQHHLAEPHVDAENGRAKHQRRGVPVHHRAFDLGAEAPGLDADWHRAHHADVWAEVAHEFGELSVGKPDIGVLDQDEIVRGRGDGRNEVADLRIEREARIARQEAHGDVGKPGCRTPPGGDHRGVFLGRGDDDLDARIELGQHGIEGCVDLRLQPLDRDDDRNWRPVGPRGCPPTQPGLDEDGSDGADTDDDGHAPPARHRHAKERNGIHHDSIRQSGGVSNCSGTST